MKQRHFAKLIGLLVVAVTAIAVLAPMASAKPKAPYTQFAGCPTTKAGITSCLHSTVNSGYFKMGSKEVPIENPIPLTGGTGPELGPIFFTAEGGLGKVKQKVPGGVVGLTGLTWLLELLGSSALTLYATTELAGTPVALGFEHLKLPIKVHLENPVLGNNCYVGSTTTPINLLLNQTNESTLKFDFETEILSSKGASFEDSVFAAPGASGCVLTLFGFIPISINGLVNTQSGLPAASGKNKTVQQIDVELVESELVKKAE
jgi:hypothetical protein